MEDHERPETSGRTWSWLERCVTETIRQHKEDLCNPGMTMEQTQFLRGRVAALSMLIDEGRTLASGKGTSFNRSD